MDQAANFPARTAEVIAVDEQIKLSGNILPQPWLHHITAAGCADVNACLVLAEIVFWYRGAEVKANGKVIGLKRKFAADLLQKSYDDLAKTLNLSHGQVQSAVCRLEKRGLIKRAFRTINHRGVKVANVLFIQLFPSNLRDICTMPEPDTLEGQPGKVNESCAEKKAGVCVQIRGGGAPEDDTSAGPTADKYREHTREYPPDHTPGKETTAAAESAEPTPADSSLFLEDHKQALSNKPGNVQPTDSQKRDVEIPVKVPGVPLTEQGGINDARHIHKVLEQAFKGLKFFGRDEVAIQAYIAEGRITLRWAEALLMAKTIFDQDRNYYKEKEFFIPVKPMYVIRDYDRTADGIIGVLNERHSKLEIANEIHDSDSLKPYLRLLHEYDDFYEQIGLLRHENGRLVLNPGSERELDDRLINPERFPYYREGDRVPPAWMRIVYAYRRSFYATRLQAELLPQAQAELRSNPTGLAAMVPPLSDDEIHTVFELRAGALQELWKELYNQRDKSMENLENLISEVLEITATAEQTEL